jgi:hypothetical protein
MRSWRRLVFGIPAAETRFDRRGFRGGTPATRERLEKVGATFVAGYHAALEEARLDHLAGRLEEVPAENRGFAYEGAAMALALLDGLIPWDRGRWRALLDGPGDAHSYMVHVGAGWAAARLGHRTKRIEAEADPLLRWLVVDGMGFHDGYFHWPRLVAGRSRPAGLQGYATRAFDQGFGRSLWFVEGAEPGRIAATIQRMAPERRQDLWSGVGLAAAYAGGATAGDLETLRYLGGEFLPALAQGASFAAEARERAGNPAPHTDLACRALCGTPAAAAARLAREALSEMPGERSYEGWRDALRARFPLPLGAADPLAAPASEAHPFPVAAGNPRG